MRRIYVWGLICLGGLVTLWLPAFIPGTILTFIGHIAVSLAVLCLIGFYVAKNMSEFMQS